MAMWQMRRVLAYETGYLNLLATDPHNSTRGRYRPSRDPERLATLFMYDETRDSPRLGTLSRHRVRHERSYTKPCMNWSGSSKPAPATTSLRPRSSKSTPILPRHRRPPSPPLPVSPSPQLALNPHKIIPITPNWL
jgi:hypothetical protein